MKRLRFAALAAALVACSSAFAESGKLERTFPFEGDKDIKIGIKVGDVTIESFRIRHWPDSDDFRRPRRT